MNYFPKTNDLSLEWYAKAISKPFHISKKDSIISMGSCFSSEMKHYLISHGYNYRQEETDKNPWVDIWPGDKGRHKSSYASCAWERVYSTHNVRQIIQASTGYKYQDRLLDSHKGVFDLMRSRILYPDMNTAEEDIYYHTQTSLSLLKSADVIIITLGVIEVWSVNGFYIAGSPNGLRCPGEYQFESLSVEQNQDNLMVICFLLKAINPNIRIVFAVTPIHLKASFMPDVDVISASCYGKSVLRVAVKNVVKKCKDVSYFPCYEIASVLLPMMGYKSYDHDHHVTTECVDKVMNVFERGYCHD